jgi:hypothetical protein
MPKVISLELAKELDGVAKEHGVDLPESEFIYVHYWGENPHYEVWNRKFAESKWDNGWWDEAMIYAYQTDELLDWLPGDTWLGNVSKRHFAAVWWDYQELGDTPPDALCKLAIAGIKEGWWIK